MPYKYNTRTDKWNYTDKNPSANKHSVGSGGSLTPPPTLESVPDKNSKGKKGSSRGGRGHDDKTTRTKEQANKRFIELEYRILKGDVKVVPNLCNHARETIGLEGLGKYLSGVYYVDAVTTHFSVSGVTQTLSLIKNGFSDTMKLRENTPKIVITDGDGKVVSNISSNNKFTPVDTYLNGNSNAIILGKTNAPKGSKLTDSNLLPQTIHYLNSGETLYDVAVKYYKNGNRWREIAKCNSIDDSKLTPLPTGRRLLIP